MCDKHKLEAPGDTPTGNTHKTGDIRESNQGCGFFEPDSIGSMPFYTPRRLSVHELHRDEDGASPLPSKLHDSAVSAPRFSDEALAQQFALENAQRLRYVDKFGCWMQWDGVKWRKDEVNVAIRYSRYICENAAREATNADGDRLARQVASRKTIEAVERLARSDHRIAATSDQWDRVSFLLNTPGGVVDLRTGETRPASPEDHMTKSTAVAPGGECPRFMAFMDQITNGDPDYVTYFQRLFGYCLTGSTKEHALFFAYGVGGNGKSVLIRTIGGLMGDYHLTAPIDTFTTSNSDRHPTDLAGLRGARLVTASETEQGRAWAETRIKSLTGEDPISARFMRRDFFEYQPQFKLFISGNHKPCLRSVDEAIRRRFNLLPFALTISEEQRDNDLFDKLKEEWPGILAWMVEGCRQWQSFGLRPPPVVKAATDEYLLGEDAFGAWLATKCERHPSYQQGATQLFDSWQTFAVSEGAAGRLNATTFPKELERRGFSKKRTNKGMTWNGIRLIADPAETGGNLP